MTATGPMHLPGRPARRWAFWALLALGLAGLGWLLVAFGHERVAATAAVGTVAIAILVVDMLTPVRLHEGAPHVTVIRVVAVIGGFAALVIFTALLTGEPWRVALARGAGVAGYFLLYHLFTRWQRRGVAPYLCPAWYGFLIAGAVGGFIAAVVAQAGADELVISGVIWSLFHYGYVRWATRSHAAPAA